MGTTNNSLIRVSDVVNAGGVRNPMSFNINENENANKLIKDKDIMKGTGQLIAPLFCNVTLKNEYGDTHLTKFQDLDIAETYPITLHVSLPSTAYTGYTLYGFSVGVTYPNGVYKGTSINVTSLSTDTNIEIENCCDNARIKVSPQSLGNSGATIASSTLGEVAANVEINSLFTEGDGVACTGSLGYPCFTLTRQLNVIDPILPPVTGDTGTVVTRKIDIYISTQNVGLYRLLIDSATYGTGSTLSEVQDIDNLRQAVIADLSKEITELPISTAAVQTTIEVPVDAYVAIYLSDPKGSASNLITMSQYSWVENNWQYVSPGNTRASVTYTVNTYQIN